MKRLVFVLLFGVPLLVGCGEGTKKKLEVIADKVDGVAERVGKVATSLAPAVAEVEDELPGDSGKYLAYVLAALTTGSTAWQRLRVKKVQGALIDSNTPGKVQSATRSELAKVGITTEPTTPDT